MYMRAKEFTNKVKSQFGKLSPVGSTKPEPEKDEAIEKIKDLAKSNK